MKSFSGVRKSVPKLLVKERDTHSILRQVEPSQNYSRHLKVEMGCSAQRYDTDLVGTDALSVESGEYSGAKFAAMSKIVQSPPVVKKGARDRVCLPWLTFGEEGKALSVFNGLANAAYHVFHLAERTGPTLHKALEFDGKTLLILTAEKKKRSQGMVSRDARQGKRADPPVVLIGFKKHDHIVQMVPRHREQVGSLSISHSRSEHEFIDCVSRLNQQHCGRVTSLLQSHLEMVIRDSLL